MCLLRPWGEKLKYRMGLLLSILVTLQVTFHFMSSSVSFLSSLTHASITPTQLPLMTLPTIQSFFVIWISAPAGTWKKKLYPVRGVPSLHMYPGSLTTWRSQYFMVHLNWRLVKNCLKWSWYTLFWMGGSLTGRHSRNRGILSTEWTAMKTMFQIIPSKLYSTKRLQHMKTIAARIRLSHSHKNPHCRYDSNNSTEASWNNQCWMWN